MTDPHAWVADRLAGAPESLRERVQLAVASLDSGTDTIAFSNALMAAAEQLLASPPASPTPPTSPHPEALRLLTADALITLACEWVAECDPAGLGQLK